jgi:pimeloyl-ACP methyl ester carboxylesterase
MSESNGKYVEVNGIQMYYEVYGSGEPLILLHGGGGSGQLNWGPYLAKFSEHFQVFVPDSRGHGKTNNPSRELSYQLLGDDFARFIQVLGLEKPSICGWSDGGQIAIELGMKTFEVGAMVIGGAYYSFAQLNLDAFRSMGMEAPGKVNFEHLQEAVPDYVEIWNQVHENWQDLVVDLSYLWFTPFEYTPQDFAKISAPALILLGDRDEFIKAEEAVKMFRMLPNGELAMIPGANHSVSRTKTEEFSSVVLEFLLRHQSLND